MNLYNTRTRQIEPFQPVTGGPDANGRPGKTAVTIYVCGITPYDTTHLGHAFTYTANDILIRYLEWLGYPVTYVQNVTDIDDDIWDKAKEVGEDWQALGDRWTAHFIRDMQALNVRPPDHFPRATDMIPQIIEQVEALLAEDVAYVANGSVYFHIDSWPEFGRLSRLPRDEMLPVANERGNHPDDPNKRDPLDFVLWQARQEPNEPAWKSPWGDGRPGWHIECSTMATFFLGDRIDIHSGGGDLCFPHHECEIAQVEPVTGQKPFVNFWLHTAMVAHEDEKMSKSLGNLVMVRDLLQEYEPDALRLYLGQRHYRQRWTHRPAELEKAARTARKLAQADRASSTGTAVIDPTPAQMRFMTAMDDDLNTEAALAALSNLADEILVAAPVGNNISLAQAALRELAAIFGLRLNAETADPRVQAGWRQHLQQFEQQKEQSL